MKAAAAVIVAIASAGVMATAQAPQQPPPQAPFRAGVDVVSLNVTVTDSPAHYVTDLTADDFNVFEDGVKQDVTFFNRTNLPIALALLLDTSASMESKLPTAQEAAIGFAQTAADAGSGRGHRLRQPRRGAAELHQQRVRSSSRRSARRRPAARRRSTTRCTSRSRI